jgi:hypothetical protein
MALCEHTRARFTVVVHGLAGGFVSRMKSRENCTLSFTSFKVPSAHKVAKREAENSQNHESYV